MKNFATYISPKFNRDIFNLCASQSVVPALAMEDCVSVASAEEPFWKPGLLITWPYPKGQNQLD